VDKRIIKKLKKFGDITTGKVISGCTAGFNMAHIHADGRVGICTFLPNIILGDIFKEPFSQIWENRIKIPEVARLVKREFNGYCKTCPDKFICGGCRARALALDHDLFGSDPYCWKHTETQ